MQRVGDQAVSTVQNESQMLRALLQRSLTLLQELDRVLHDESDDSIHKAAEHEAMREWQRLKQDLDRHGIR